MQDSVLPNFYLSKSNFSPGQRGNGVGLSIRAEEMRNFGSTAIHSVHSLTDFVLNISELYNLTDIQTL